jgi:hypothetical protein
MHVRRRLSVRLALVAALIASAAGCASSDRYQSISLAPDNPNAELRALAQRAKAGDKRAQLSLGIRFETGDGVPLDLDRAERLYEMAAATSGDTRDLYIPPMRPDRGGRVVPAWPRPPVAGLETARRRLQALRERRRGQGSAG